MNSGSTIYCQLGAAVKHLVWVLFLCLFLAGCQLPVSPVLPAEDAAFGQPFTLQLGQTAHLSEVGLDVTFASLLTDGRCPTNIQCAATLPVEVEIAIRRSGSPTGDSLQLSAHTDETGAVIPTAPDVVTSAIVNGSTYTLLAVTPYPDAQHKSASAAYLVTLLVTGAEASSSPEIEPTAVPSDEPSTATLGIEVAIGVGEALLLPDEQLSLRFEEVTDDSRCPLDVSCAWSGVVNVRMTAALADQQPETFVVGGTTDSNGVVRGAVVGASGPTSWWYAGFVVDLKQVIPYPAHANRPTAPNAYHATVVITKGEDNRPQEPTAEPSPTDIPFPTDSNGLSIFCISEVAAVRLAAGESTAPPSALTPPVAQQTLVDEATADRLCAGQFGEDWHIAETYNLGGIWEDYLPAGSVYWVWDYQNLRAIQSP